MKLELQSILLCIYLASVTSGAALAADTSETPAQKQIQEAVKLMNGKRYREAVKLLEQALESAKKNKDQQAEALATLNLMESYAKIGNYKASSELCKQVIRQYDRAGDEQAGVKPSAELQKAREAEIQNQHESNSSRPDEQSMTKRRKILQNLIDEYEKAGRVRETLPSYRQLYYCCIDQFGIYHPETLKVAKARAVAQEKAGSDDYVESKKLADEIEKGLKEGKKGGHPSFCVGIDVK